MSFLFFFQSNSLLRINLNVYFLKRCLKSVPWRLALRYDGNNQYSPRSYIYCKQITGFHCVCLSHRGWLIWVKYVNIPKQNFEKQLDVNNPVHLLSDKARCFSQSECALRGKFILSCLDLKVIMQGCCWLNLSSH